MKDTIIKSEDSLTGVGDYFKRIRGHVHIYEEVDGKKELLHKDNLIVYIGREMLAQRLVNISNPYFSGDPNKPTKDEFVSWFGLGNGGVSPADPLTPNPPILTDTALYAPIPMVDAVTAGYSDYRTSPYAGCYVKQFDNYDSTAAITSDFGVQFYADDLNNNQYLILQITTTVGVNDANGYQLSEAGLFSAESSAVTNPTTSNFTLFARITFPTLIKTADRRLIFVWYLYV